MRWGVLLAAGLAVALVGLGSGRGRQVSAQDAAAAVSGPTATAIAPGKDLRPQFSEPVRVGIILKLIADVYQGNSLPFPKDGVVFENRQKLLPDKPLGYYHEYTVLPPKGTPYNVTIGEQTFSIEVPPSGNRGAERLIIGGGAVLYYTPDHYKTFIPLQVLR
jgi:ribonuclease T1